ncbi:hypothetical protein IscW_ISCW003610, partial [Ixodes scapularis]
STTAIESSSLSVNSSEAAIPRHGTNTSAATPNTCKLNRTHSSSHHPHPFPNPPFSEEAEDERSQKTAGTLPSFPKS